MGLLGTFDGGLVTTETVGEESRDPPDRGHTDTGEVVDLSVGEILLQVFHHLPAIDERLKFGRRAQILEEITAFLKALEAVDGFEQGALGIGLLTAAIVTIGLHECTSVLMRYYTSTSTTNTQPQKVSVTLLTRNRETDTFRLVTGEILKRVSVG